MWFDFKTWLFSFCHCHQGGLLAQMRNKKIWTGDKEQRESDRELCWSRTKIASKIRKPFKNMKRNQFLFKRQKFQQQIARNQCDEFNRLLGFLALSLARSVRSLVHFVFSFSLNIILGILLSCVRVYVCVCVPNSNVQLKMGVRLMNIIGIKFLCDVSSLLSRIYIIRFILLENNGGSG